MAEKILIVDDDADTLHLVGLMLQRQGYEIEAASSGEKALAMSERSMPDLILLDLMMPDMDGIEVTRQLRSRASTRDVPIIMFTARSDVEDKIEGYEAGADDYLTKPTQPRELFAHVKAVLARTSKGRPAPETPAVPLRRATTIGVLGVRGGLGVSTLVLNLGVALREKTRQEVIVAEYRPGLGTLSQELGYTTVEGQNRLLQRSPGGISPPLISQELFAHPSGVRFLLSSPQPRHALYSNMAFNFEAITHCLIEMAQFVVLDLGVSLNPIADKVLPLCNEVLLVVDPVPQTVKQTKALIQDMVDNGIGEGLISVVLVNRVRSSTQMTVAQVQESLGLKIARVFTPAPELFYQASIHNLPMITIEPDGLTAQQFMQMSDLIVQRAHA